MPSPLSYAIFAFSALCFVFGIYFLRIETIEKEIPWLKGIGAVSLTFGIAQLFMVASILIVTGPLGQLSEWASAIFGMFGFYTTATGIAILGEGDTRPVSYMGPFIGAICIFYAWSTIPLGFSIWWFTLLILAAIIFFTIPLTLRNQKVWVKICATACILISINGFYLGVDSLLPVITGG